MNGIQIRVYFAMYLYAVALPVKEVHYTIKNQPIHGQVTTSMCIKH